MKKSYSGFIDIELKDVLEFMSRATNHEITQIKKELKFAEDSDGEMIIAKNLLEREKILILKKAFNKYSIEQLLDKLGIKQNEV